MNTKTLSARALSVIDQYQHFKAGGAVCSVPYFNNKTVKARAALPVYVGKGSPKEIFDEVQGIMIKSHIQADLLADESLKRLLVENNIGIDCSGFAYYVLNAESEESGKGSLSRHVSFVRSHGLLGRLIYKLHPEKNTDVVTLADDKNSHTILLKEARPGDIVTMIGGPEGPSQNHILVIREVEYQNFIPLKISYSHAMAYPEDGLYETGIRQGVITVADAHKPLLEARWAEEGREGADNLLLRRTRGSKMEIRRLKWL